MKSNKKHLILRIAKLKEAIRRKYNSFKSGVSESERFFEKKYKPIISEIKKAGFTPKNELTIKKEEPNEEEEEEEYHEMEQDEEQEEESKDFSPHVTPGDTSQIDTLLSTPQGRDTVSMYINEQFQNDLTKQYMDLFMRDRGGRKTMIDHTYGPRLNENGDLCMIGNKKLEFDEDGSIIIDGTAYNGTEGLYELIFKRTPYGYDENDQEIYKEILEKTNAHKKGYKSTANINRNTSTKYKNIIEKLFPNTKQGSGMQWKSPVSRDILHWDDPNELVDRLRLLVMSAETGNNSHSNEIINIIEELREGGYIKGSGNNRFKSLLK